MKLPKTYTTETKRCRLRIVSKEDAPSVFSASRHSGFNDGMVWDPPTTIEELSEPFKKNIMSWEQGTAYSFTIEGKTSGLFIGRISVRSEEGQSVWDVGYWTHPEEQGKGYATEALASVLDLAFSSLGATRVEASYALWNKASKRVLEKAGMRFVRHVPEGFMKNGRWVEEHLMAVDRGEWNMASPRSAAAHE